MYSDKLLFRYYRYTLGSTINYFKLLFLGARPLNLQDVPSEKIHVGDIDVAYKMFGKGYPILLYNGASDNMDAWDSSHLEVLSSNHTVIVFDQRGIQQLVPNHTLLSC